jgi:adenylosuccinate lyase
MKREDAYRIVQQSAMEVWQNGREFKDMLLAEPAVRDVLGVDGIEALFDLNRSIRNVDVIFARAGLS